MTGQSPLVSVGLLTADIIRFTLSDAPGVREARVSSAGLGVEYEGAVVPELLFEPAGPDGWFEIEDVVIGVNFHWERRERQRFRGALRIVCDRGRLTAINILPVEEYLVSVISSEMHSTSSADLLMAHAVISRSWLLSMIGGNGRRRQALRSSGQYIRWWDREDHELFDVCADDHCQRYQGIGRIDPESAAARAVRDTRGIVLACDGELCDTRFSKCCGGVFERFSSCWGDEDYPYLTERRDYTDPADFPDLTDETEAERWILGSPDAFCNTADPRLLSQVLNEYDREQTDFYRWRVDYTSGRLTELINRRLETDLGAIIDLIPVERGPSGRIVRLRIVGEKGEVTIGKELMIRRALSESHLRSSAFVVRKTGEGFTLYGAGWGHGVGLCQIGAAVMADRGYAWHEILRHYYPGADTIRKYG